MVLVLVVARMVLRSALDFFVQFLFQLLVVLFCTANVPVLGRINRLPGYLGTARKEDAAGGKARHHHQDEQNKNAHDYKNVRVTLCGGHKAVYCRTDHRFSLVHYLFYTRPCGRCTAGYSFFASNGLCRCATRPNFKEETSAKKTRSPPKKARVEQSTPKKKKLKLDADKAAEKNQHLRFGKAELTPDELSRLSKAQKREMYAANAARSAVHREIDQYEEDNVGVQALSEGEKAAGNVRDISKSRYARKLKKKAKMQGKKGTKTARSSAQNPTSAQDAGASGTGEGGSNWLSRWKQRQEIHKSYYAAARSGTACSRGGRRGCA